jgi:DNA invertase Pin-like site-specific DNA recombinase
MRVIAYIYSDPILETSPENISWGWDVEGVYHDLGERSHLQKLLQECENEEIDILVIRRLEELGNNLETVTKVMTQIQAMDIRLIAIYQGYDSGSDTPNLKIELLRLLQEIQYNLRSRRIRQGHASNRLEAAPPPGKTPYGYKKNKSKYIVDKSTSPVVKDFFDNFLLYGSLRGSVRYLAKKYGKKISVTTGKRWLTNSVYRGDTSYHNGEIILNTHGAIISREEAAQIDRLLGRNSRLPPRSASARRSLAGLVICGECQSGMTITRVTIRKQDKEYLYLRPINCPHKQKCKAISYDQVLDETIQSVCRELPQAVAGINSPQLDAIKNDLLTKINHQEKILDKIPSLMEAGIFDTETAKLRIYKIRTEISLLQKQLATLPPVNLIAVAQSVSIPQFWLDLSETERRFYFREFISNIQLIRQEKQWQLKIIFIF